LEINYVYDFGSSTELMVKVLGKCQGPKKEGGIIEVLARNEAPTILCDECDKNIAKQICTECQWYDVGWLCDKCVENHECGEEMMLPVVNSPRTGVCGYTGN
jgi:hypothetical protein